MNLLKRIPIHYQGQLYDVRLVNFSIDARELQGRIPSQIQLRDFAGRAMISMVDVKLRNMRPTFLPAGLYFNYRHVAFRVLVDDGRYNDGVQKGIFFYRSFTDKYFAVIGGKLLTDYNLEGATINEDGDDVGIFQGADYIRYRIGREPMVDADEALKSIVGSVDRAYSVLGKTLRVTQIQRQQWPIRQVRCSGFENTFFKTAKLEGAFRVFETIHYDWMPPKPVNR